MSNADIVFTVSAPDRPGIVKALSDLVLMQGGSWLESSLTRLCGEFTGIVHVRIPEANRRQLLLQLADCEAQGISVTIRDARWQENTRHGEAGTQLRVLVEANDREGIVDEIAGALAARQINVEKLTSSCESASMAGYPLFRANIKVRLPHDIDARQLESILESVSDDLMVTIKPDASD
ncbi:MAG: ACT domain-containing protein [Pseudomonadales bacterium]